MPWHGVLSSDQSGQLKLVSWREKDSVVLWWRQAGRENGRFFRAGVTSLESGSIGRRRGLQAARMLPDTGGRATVRSFPQGALSRALKGRFLLQFVPALFALLESPL